MRLAVASTATLPALRSPQGEGGSFLRKQESTFRHLPSVFCFVRNVLQVRPACPRMSLSGACPCNVVGRGPTNYYLTYLTGFTRRSVWRVYPACPVRLVRRRRMRLPRGTCPVRCAVYYLTGVCRVLSHQGISSALRYSNLYAIIWSISNTVSSPSPSISPPSNVPAHKWQL